MDRPGLLSSTEAREAKISRNPTRSNATQRTDFLRKAHLRFQRRKLVGGFSLGSTHLVLCRQWLRCCHSSHSSWSSPSTSSTPSTSSSAARWTLLSARRCTGDYGGRTDGQVPTGIERCPTQRLLLEQGGEPTLRHASHSAALSIAARFYEFSLKFSKISRRIFAEIKNKHIQFFYLI